MNLLTSIIIWLNTIANALGKILFAPIIVNTPGWLSNTIISAIVGLLLLIIFKYTSNQAAIGKTRDSIKAAMLALKLFKDSMAVTMKSQRQLFGGAFALLFHAIRPMLVMIVPVVLIISQMAAFYQNSPLKIGDKTMVTLQLNPDVKSDWPNVQLNTSEAFDIVTGPVRASANHQLYWIIKAQKDGPHKINFSVGTDQFQKKLAIGSDFMLISPKRPGRNISDLLMNPCEKPFSTDSVVQSISIDYPDRISKTSGTDYWIIFFFVISMIFAFIFKPFLNVKI